MNDAINRRTSNRTYPSQIKEILINEKPFVLNNISGEGIGILVEDKFYFSLGQRIRSICLENHVDARHLPGIVNHISQNDSGIVCGIRFDFRDSTEFKYVEEIIRALTVE